MHRIKKMKERTETKKNTEKKRLEVTLVVVLRLIMMVIVDGTHTHTHRHKHKDRRKKKELLQYPCLEMDGKKGLMSRKRKHTNSRITVLVVDRDTERLSRMYKILLCYAQTHKYIIYIERLRERQSITVQKEKSTFLTRKAEQIREREKDMMRRKSFSKKERRKDIDNFLKKKKKK